MSASIKRIDARGLACPEPVILTKRALEEGGFDELEILVDGPTARENVSRFAAHSGWAVEAADGTAGAATLRLHPMAGAGRGGAALSSVAAASADAAAAGLSALGDAAAATVFVSSDRIGSGSDELGELLMRGFLKALAEAAERPRRIVFMNAGVKLALDDSPALASLRALAEAGVELISCGTCLDYYKAKERLAVGRVSNMLEISGFLLEGRTLSL